MSVIVLSHPNYTPIYTESQVYESMSIFLWYGSTTKFLYV